MDKFYLDKYVDSIKQGNECQKLNEVDFEKICHLIQMDFMNEWNSDKEDLSTMLNVQKKAIIGYEKEVAFFKDKIRSFLKNHQLTNLNFPSYYETIEDGIYHECFGLAGISEWFTEKYTQSSSAKIIGNRIYFLEAGKMILKKQTISKERREQLIRAFLLLTPEERLDKDFHEIYMLDGTRITVFGGEMTKKNQETIIFRRYTVPIYTFEEQAKRGTIPSNSIELFLAMVEIGYNVAFLGAVRSAKTTFLSTWQSYEDESLEGVMVETDPEIPLHNIMPKAPIIQLIADNEFLHRISKNLLRTDADYFILAEARDGIALDTAIKIASKGTKRMKITFHTRDPLDFCYEIANEIIKSIGGGLESNQGKVAKSFDYLFHFVQLKDKSQKRLKAIYELSFDNVNKVPVYYQICKYDYRSDSWEWFYKISQSKIDFGEEESPEAFKKFEYQLRTLSNGNEI
jgi:pilus assembly protein CpaF